MSRGLVLLLLALSLGLAGCSEPGAVDGGADAARLDDDGGPDDGSVPVDAPMDASSGLDGGEAGAGDAGREAGAAPMDALPPDTGPRDAGSPDTGPRDAGPPDAGAPDAGPLTLEVRVLADGLCDELSFDPASITVAAGTEFTVRWVNATGCTPIDIDKDGTVPIVLDLAPGESYHDTVRRWCGSLFTGTFHFRAYYSAIYPFTLPVDCGG